VGAVPAPKQVQGLIRMTTGADIWTLARDIIEVHGARAPAVARENARAAAIGRQPDQARSWIRVLGVIQRHQANAPPHRGPEYPSRFPSGPDITEGSS
jgi:hypothetical protein